MPEFAEVADGLQMPLADAMRTQRAVRRLRPDPVDDETVLELLRLAVKAPTGSNAQSWEFVVVRNPDVKHQLARLNRQAWSLYRRIAQSRARGDLSQARILAAVQWQADHFEDAPVIIVACLHGPVRSRPTWAGPRTTARSSRRSRTCSSPPGPSASAPRSPPSPSGPARLARRTLGLPARRHAVRGDPARLADGRRLRAHHPAPGRGGHPPRPLREPGVSRRSEAGSGSALSAARSTCAAKCEIIGLCLESTRPGRG